MNITPGQVYNTDCLKGLVDMPPGSVDLVFADPPFNIGYDYDQYDDRRKHADYLAWSRDWIRAIHRVLKPDGTFWLAIGDEYAAELKLIAQNDHPAFSLRQRPCEPTRDREPRSKGRDRSPSKNAAADASKDTSNESSPETALYPGDEPIAFHCRSWVIWYYTFGVHCTRKFTRSHAHLFHFVKNAKKFTFNVDAIRVPSARQLVYNDKRANPRGRMPDDTWLIPPAAGEPPLPAKTASRGPKAAAPPTAGGFILRPQDIPERFQPEEDVWYFSRVAGTFLERQGWHGCQMPEQLLGRIIRACSHEGDIVCDPFTGSGTTLAVAKKLGRGFVGFEVSQDYAAAARARLKASSAGEALNGATDSLTSAPTTNEPRPARRPRAPDPNHQPLFEDETSTEETQIDGEENITAA